MINHENRHKPVFCWFIFRYIRVCPTSTQNAMKQICCTLLVILQASPLLLAQRSAPDQIPSAKGMISVQPILHATLAITWNGKVIYADPYGGAKAFEGIAPPDLILITDIHGDHMNIETLQTLDTDKATIIAPQAVADRLPDDLRLKTIVLNNGGTTDQHGIPVTAIPMYNLPEAEDSRHPKGRGNGYILNLGGKRVYISGDTEDIVEMRALQNIDIAFVCMNQPFTMKVEQAASAVLAFKPTIVYPFHFRGQGGLSDVEAFKKLVEEGNKKIEVRLRNWYPTY
jgi:L-ascorbate metabolism protein UlaG (beta-lactamase superfamily)